MHHFFRNKTVVFLSGMPWNYYLHSYRSLFAKELAKTNEVFWINPPKRNPMKAIAANKAFKKSEYGVRVFTPWLPKSQYCGLNAIDVWLLLAQLRRQAGALDNSRTVFWSVYYSHFEVMPKVPSATKIYWPGDTFDPVQELEGLSEYDLIMPLTEEKEAVVRRRYPGKSMLSTTGCDFERFQQGRTAEIPSEFSSLKRPVVGYVGNVSHFRLDFDLIAAVCAGLPDASFVFVGALDSDPQTAEAVASLKARFCNIHFAGHRPYEELPKYINSFDVGIIPYKLTGFNLGSNPNKAYEYFALGKPVVSVALPSLEKYAEQIHLAGNAGEFIEQVRLAIADQLTMESRQARIEIARLCSPVETLRRIDEHFMNLTLAAAPGLQSPVVATIAP